MRLISNIYADVNLILYRIVLWGWNILKVHFFTKTKYVIG